MVSRRARVKHPPRARSAALALPHRDQRPGHGKGLTPLPHGHLTGCGESMMTGAKIMLGTGIQAARDGLISLAGATWMMSLPQRQAAHRDHPAGQARPGLSAGHGTALVAVTFGDSAVLAAEHVIVSVRWEPVEPGDAPVVLLDGDLTLAPAAGPGQSVLTMAGTCAVATGALTPEAREQVRRELDEASLEFLISVADSVIHGAGAGSERGLGPG